jgi:uncharacterized membrane protein (UPF0127 family)
MTCLRCIVLALALGAGFGPAVAQTAPPMPAPQTTLSHATLTAGMYRIDVQLATTPEEREIGLMYRKSMPEYEGMLFVFNRPGVQCFWMKNTLIPLTAAFIADDGTIVNLADMQPLDETSHCSARPVRFVLEMNQGWFNQKHVLAGSRLGGSPFEPQ